MAKNVKHVLMIVAMVVFASAHGPESGLRVIANFSVKTNSISAAELKSIFLEERTSLADGTHVQPVLAKGGAAHEAFLRFYLHKTDSGLQRYYRSLVFSGKGLMPEAVESDVQMITYVARTKGAIGYVGTDVHVEGVKILEVK